MLFHLARVNVWNSTDSSFGQNDIGNQTRWEDLDGNQSYVELLVHVFQSIIGRSHCIRGSNDPFLPIFEKCGLFLDG